MKTLNASSGDYTAIFHSASAYDARSDRLQTHVNKNGRQKGTELGLILSSCIDVTVA